MSGELNILDEIVQKRKADIAQKGICLAYNVPQTRLRAEPVPFVAEKCSILEIKRASPSKGDIAPNLNAAQTAGQYAAAGTGAISVLTEEHYFKGSLQDLMDACRAVDEYAEKNNTPRTAILRKDFLLNEQEVEVAWKCGADAVLLIARILDRETLLKMARKCESYGMTAFIELRLEEDLEKLAYISDKVQRKSIVCGVNARDLKNFSIDLLTPAGILPRIQKLLGKDARVVFESGIRTPQAAKFAGSLGFTGMLLGEAAARNPNEASALVQGFVKSKTNASAKQWLTYADELYQKEHPQNKGHECSHGNADESKRPYLKICGLTNVQDALYATLSGADFLGFIFSEKSPRCVRQETVEQVRQILTEEFSGEKILDEKIVSAGTEDKAPKLVGVITEIKSTLAQQALELAKSGKLDFIQLHGSQAVKEFFESPELADIPHYAVVNVSSGKDIEEIEKLLNLGEPRILVDAKSKDSIGGTGTCIEEELVHLVQKRTKLWLAGGIKPDNAAHIVAAFHPELIDVSSGVEESVGHKDNDLLLALDSAIASGSAE